MKRFHFTRLSSITLVAAALGACGSNGTGASSAELEGVPEQSALQLSVTDDASSEGLATEADAVDPSEMLDDAGEAMTGAVDVAPELKNAREAVRRLNQALRAFLQPIAALVRDTAPTSSVGDVKVWGPLTRGPTEFRFALRHGLAHHWGWVLEARAAGSSDAFVLVAAGGIHVGFAVRRGTGTVGLDLDALGSVDPTVSARGAVLVRFAHGPLGSTLGYRLRAFTPDPSQNQPIDALAQDVHLKLGANRLRLAFRGDVPGTATDAEELVLARVRHVRGEGGRADLIATGGDIAEGRAWVVSECWNSQLQSGYRVVRECSAAGVGGAQCDVVSTSGDVTACARTLLTPDLPPADPLAPMSDPESPAGDVTPPDAMPDGTPPTDD